MRLANLAWKLLLCALMVTSWSFAKGKQISREELIHRHLDSIGPAEARSRAAVRIVQGKVVFSEIVSKTVNVPGTSTFVSQGKKFKCAFQFAVPQYPGEQIVFDGQHAMVATVDPVNRSSLGSFLFAQDGILQEGFFGGTLSEAWPLLENRGAIEGAKYEGLHKVDGREAHDLSFALSKQHGGGEFRIHLYFDPQSYRHIMTSYVWTTHNPSGNAIEGNDETVQTLEERFDDFRTQDGLTLPFHWTIRYRITPQSRTREYQWESAFETITLQAAQ